MSRWHRAGVVSDNLHPSRPWQLQGSRRGTPRTISDRILQPTPVTLPLRGSLPSLDPALQHSLGFPPFCPAASLWASLAPTFRCSLEVRRAFLSELRTGCASGQPRSMEFREIQTFSPPFSCSSPRCGDTIPCFSPWHNGRQTTQRGARPPCGRPRGRRGSYPFVRAGRGHGGDTRRDRRPQLGRLCDRPGCDATRRLFGPDEP